jgi:hypothetical protein
MIPKEFKETTKLKEEFENYMAQFEYDEISEEFAHLPPPEVQEKEYKASDEYKFKEQTKRSFSDEYKKLTGSNSYFLGCTYNSYSTTYEKRLQDFTDTYIDAEEHNFIIDELELISAYQFSDLIQENLKKNIKYSLEKTSHYLKEKLKSLGYRIENKITNEGKVNSIAIKDASVIKLDNEPVIDLSDSKPIDKIRYLGLIGFFKYIRDREPHLNTNQIASLISGVTGIKQRTIQSYINPILSSEVSQKKNPFMNKKKVTEIKRELINIGIVKIENL